MPYNYPTAFYARHRVYILPQINLYKTYRKKNRTHRRHSSESYVSEIYDTTPHSRHISVVPAKKEVGREQPSFAARARPSSWQVCFMHRSWYNSGVAYPIPATERGSISMPLRFLEAVAASVVAYYLCKWFVLYKCREKYLCTYFFDMMRVIG